MRFVWRLPDQERIEVTRFLYGNSIQTVGFDRINEVIGIRGIAPTRFYCTRKASKLFNCGGFGGGVLAL